MLKVNKLKDYKYEELKKNQNLNLDELYNTRKELIENYTNKIVDYKKSEEVSEQILEELDNYKLKKLSSSTNGNTLSILLDNDVMTGGNMYNTYFNELQKKEYEIKQNKKKINSNDDYNTFESEITDVTSLLSNLNKINKNANNQNDQSTSNYEKILSALNSGNLRNTNRGYAFVTFSTSDESKQLYIQGLTGIKIGKFQVKIEPKFDLNHQHFNEKLFYERAKFDGNIIDKREELIKAENKLIEFEQNFHKNLDENENLKEFNNVRDAFKDLYSDPFKKHDQTNPFTEEDDEEIKFRLRQENSWLMEDDNIEKLRKSRDKRILKKYTEAQLIKKGILSKDSYVDSNNKDPKYNCIKHLTDSYFSKNNEFIPNSNNESYSYPGRRLNPIGSSEFIEKMHSDRLNLMAQDSPSFPIYKRENSVYSELKS
jgi:hypothetical protein